MRTYDRILTVSSHESRADVPCVDSPKHGAEAMPYRSLGPRWSLGPVCYFVLGCGCDRGALFLTGVIAILRRGA